MTNTILITGASAGLGRATAKLFQEKGWNVVATMRDPSKEAELNQLPNVVVPRLDVEDAISIRSAIDTGIDAFGRIDVLVNNAGFGAFGPLELTPIETVRRQFEVNLFGVLQTTQAILPHFRKASSGTIVNVTSVGGRLGLPFGSLYHGTKFAVEGVTESLQYELSPLGIRVRLVEPGGIKTDFGGRSLVFSNDPSVAEYQPLIEAAMQGYGSLVAAGSEPELIAEVVYRAATDETGPLRYHAGADAEQIFAQRAAVSDDVFFSGIKAMFGFGG